MAIFKQQGRSCLRMTPTQNEVKVEPGPNDIVAACVFSHA